MSDLSPLAGQVIVVVGALSRLTRRDTAALVERHQGRVASHVTRDTTLLIVADAIAAAGGRDPRLADAHRLNARFPGRVRIASEREFYELAGLPAPPMPDRSKPEPPSKPESPEPPFRREQQGTSAASKAGSRRATSVEAGTADAAKPEPAGKPDAAGKSEPGGAASDAYGSKQIRARYPNLRDDHLRYLERWGLIRPLRRVRQESFYSFADVAVIRQVSAELAKGLSFRAALRGLVAAREGQLALDFQPPKGDAQPAKVVALAPRPAAPRDAARTGPGPVRGQETLDRAATYFEQGTLLDQGDVESQQRAMAAYRQAFALDPTLVAALVNLANIHYAHDEIIEAEALYEKVLAQDPSCFEAHFNLGNVYHDAGRFDFAVHCYDRALSLDPAYADAHFYLAVTLEKLGRSADARPHWVAYQRLAPDGEWVELAREFSE